MAKVLVGRKSDVREGKTVSVTAGGREILIANIHGRYVATGNTCTHAGAELHEGQLHDKIITCPWHGAKWDLTTGELIWFPQKLQSIGSYKIFVEDDTLFVEV
jgi:nitrite reductase/ring-hydroxylating ferredoxin subunit